MKTLFALLIVAVALPAHAYIDAFPSFLNFTDTVIGQRSLSQSITIANRGTEDINGLFISPSCGIDFDVYQGSCYGTLRANQSCYMNVTFSPSREGYASCSINVSSSSGSAYISASGRGVKKQFPLKAKAPRPLPVQKR